MKAFWTRWLARPAPLAASLAAPGLAFDLHLSLYTDAGPVRARNEDFIAALDTALPGTPGARCTLVALADGMGGHQAGELASRLAVSAALRVFEQSSGGLDPSAATDLAQILQAALAGANAAVYEEAQGVAQWQGMGTTLLLFVPTPHGAYCGWVGDSRLYLWRSGTLTLLTRDDTLVRGLLERGLIGAADVAQHPDHSVLTQAVGTHAEIPSPHVTGPFELGLGDRFLLCSDGVHDVVPSAELAAALQATRPHEAAHQIHQAALQNGADDNLSIGIVDIAPKATTTSSPKAPRTTRHNSEALS